ncbi:MAG: heme exporter protein CcmB [Actinomycetota bacterium]|nr:heme exporter protein CcmB [Actinomycetota bacterium]
MSTWRIARLIAAKDLRVEWRSRVLINQVLPFATLVMVMFAFALDNNDRVLTRVAPGLVWLATMFSLLVVVQRTFAVETADGALDALQVAGVRPGGVFLGKALALAAQLAALELVLMGAAVVLYRTEFQAGGVVLLVTTYLAATTGLAFVGTLYGGLAAGAKGRETLLPLLMLPVVAPVLIGATRATEAALGTEGATPSDGWPWIGLLTLFAALFGVGGTMAFGSLIDE